MIPIIIGEHGRECTDRELDLVNAISSWNINATDYCAYQAKYIMNHLLTSLQHYNPLHKVWEP